MMRLVRSLRTMVAGALVAAMPFTMANAATRPASAIPAASATSAQDPRDLCDPAHATEAACAPGNGAAPVATSAYGGFAWPAVAVIIGAVATAVLIESHDGKGRGSGFSR